MSSQNLITFSATGINDALLVTRLDAVDRISDLYSYAFELVSTADDVDAATVLHTTAEINVRQGVVTSGGTRGSRRITTRGIVTEFVECGKRNKWTVYKATVRPKHWALTLNRASRVWLDMSIPEIIKDILEGSDYSFVHESDFDISGPLQENTTEADRTYQKRDYVVQYDESDYDFISRWLEREGICFWFSQTDSGEKMVFADSSAAYRTVSGLAVDSGGNAPGLEYNPSNSDETLLEVPDQSSTADWFSDETIQVLMTTNRRQAKEVLLRGYDWRNPSAALDCTANVDTQSCGTLFGPYSNYTDTDEGDRLATAHAQARTCRDRAVRGRSDCRSLEPGAKFTLTSHFRSAMGIEWVVTEVEHHATQTISESTQATVDASYYNDFEAIPASETWRPMPGTTAWPRIDGVVHATIEAATSGATYAYLNDEGCYRVRLPFDQTAGGKSAGQASKWIRMARGYVASNAGMHLPLLDGTEVLLSHINGDPDRPVIAGAVHNGSVPDLVSSTGTAKNRLRTNSGNIIEMDDTSGAEGILMANGSMSAVMSFRNGDAAGAGGTSGFLAPGQTLGSGGSSNGSGSSGGSSGNQGSLGNGGGATALAGTPKTGNTNAPAAASLIDRLGGVFSGPAAQYDLNNGMPPIWRDSGSGSSNGSGSDTSVEDAFFAAHSDTSKWPDGADTSFDQTDYENALKDIGPGSKYACVTTSDRTANQSLSYDALDDCGMFEASRVRVGYTLGSDLQVINGQRGVYTTGSSSEVVIGYNYDSSNTDRLSGDRVDVYYKVDQENREIVCNATNFTLTVNDHDTGGDQVSRPSAAECLAVGRLFSIADTITGSTYTTDSYTGVSYAADASKINDNEIREFVRARIQNETVDLTAAGNKCYILSTESTGNQGLVKTVPSWSDANADNSDHLPSSRAENGEQRGMVYADRVTDYTNCTTGDGVIADYDYAKTILQYTKADTIREKIRADDMYQRVDGGLSRELWTGAFYELFAGAHGSFKCGTSVNMFIGSITDCHLGSVSDIKIGACTEITLAWRGAYHLTEEKSLSLKKAVMAATLCSTIAPIIELGAGLVKLGTATASFMKDPAGIGKAMEGMTIFP